MLKVADLFANLSLVCTDFSTGLRQAASEAQAAGKEISNALTGNLNKNLKYTSDNLNNFARETKSSFKDISRIVQGILISQTFYGMVSAIKRATGALVDYNTELEQTKIAFKYLIGSANGANKYIRAVQDFAAVTPFTTKSAAESSKMLMAMGFSAKQVLPVLQTLSDASAVSGADPETFKRIVYAMGQIKTSGKLMRQDLMQLASAGIPVFQILREELGLTQKQLNNLGKAGVSSDAAINAILRGLQKRYKGAAEEISHTTKGLLSTIKDSLSITGNVITENLMKRARNQLEIIARKLEKIRAIVTHQGVGGLLKYLFPPEMQVQVRAAIGYFNALVHEIRRIAIELRPVNRELINVFIVTFNAICPVLITFLRILNSLIHVIAKNTILVRGLAFSIVGLKIASTVSTFIKTLSCAIRGLYVCGPIARLVSLLARSIRVLLITITEHPVGAIITIICGALLALALSSKTATAWIDRLTQSLGRLFGFNVEDIWKPIDPGKVNDDLNEFYQGLKDNGNSANALGDAVDDVGKKAKKAGKTIKDKFIASFDEVHRIPEETKKASDALNDAGKNIGGIGGIMPKFPDYTIPKIKTPKLPAFKWPKIPPFPPFPPFPKLPKLPKLGIRDWLKQTLEELQQAWNRIKDFLRQPWPAIPPLKVPGIDWGPLGQNIKNKIRNLGNDVIGGISDVLDALPSICANAGRAIEQAFDRVPDVIGTTVSTVLSLKPALTLGFKGLPDIIGNPLEGACKSIDNFKSKVNSFQEWLNQHATNIGQSLGINFNSVLSKISTQCGVFGKALKGTFTTGGSSILQFVTNTESALKTWTAASAVSIGNFVSITNPQINSWVSHHTGAFRAWASNTSAAVASGAKSICSSIGQFTSSTLGEINGWITSTMAVIGNWVKSTGTSLGSWTTDVGTKLNLWGQQAIGSIGAWATNTGKNISTWCAHHKKGIIVATTITATALLAWATGGISAIADFAGTAGPVIATWAVTAGKNIFTFAAEAGSKIGEWVKISGNNIGDFAGGAAGNIKTGMLAGLGAIASFTAVAAPKIRNWVIATVANIKNWKDNTVQQVKTSCSTMGGHIQTFKSVAQQKFSETWQNIKGGASTAWSYMTSSFSATTSSLQSMAYNFRSGFSSIFGGLADIAKSAFHGVAAVIGAVMRPVIRGMNTLIRGLNRFRIDVPDWVPGLGGHSFGFDIPTIPVPGFATGGIIRKDSLIRAGENNKQEMIVPLENSAALQPFADAIAKRIKFKPEPNNNNNNNPPQQVLYVGTLIADERSLVELERKMKIIRMKEGRR